MSDYKNTLNLPETGFPMRGDLAKREPGMLQRWYEQDLYGIIRTAKKAKPVLCDTCQGLRCRCCGVLQDWSDSWSPVVG
jgi:hypothetical protein